jgi:hypothetical protein
MNLKKNQIKFTPVEATAKDRSVSREGKLKVKINQNPLKMSEGLKIA